VDHRDRIQVATDEVGLAEADPNRNIYEYGSGSELISWPVALAMASNIQYSNNWDWGVRATSYADAASKKQYISQDLAMTLCPSDRVEIASPFYPRNKSQTIGGIDNDGLRGDSAPPIASSVNMSYWGRLSYAISEDIAGVEVAESNGAPACWRSVENGGGYTECIGEINYPPMHPCGKDGRGRRLRGLLERVYSPGTCGLIFEAGRDDASQNEAGFANLIISAQTMGPFLGDFQQRHNLRMPTKRHMKGRLNVLYADMHGGTTRPVKFDAENGLPEEYAPNVRVSPYAPFGNK
jgi:hypothetical protein